MRRRSRNYSALGLCALLSAGASLAACASPCGDLGGGGTLVACVDPQTHNGPECIPASTSRTAVIVELGFVRQSDSVQTVEGFNIDDRVSAASDTMSCRQADFTAADGTTGIDNQLAILLPIVDSMTGGALEGAIQGAINNGQQLLMLTVEGLDNTCRDDEATLVIQRASGTPFVGADMRLDPGQTFDAIREEPPTRVPAEVRDGVLTAGPFTLPLPVAVLTARFTLNLYNARVRARLLPDGSIEGLIGGGIDREEFMREVRLLKIPMSLMDQIGGALTLFADLDRNTSGRCTRLSSAVQFRARPAFVNP